MSTSDLNLKRFSTKLKKDIVPNLKDENSQENVLLSKSLVALYFASEAGMDIGESPIYVVDGREDFGIDGLYFDSRKDILHIVQAKFRTNQNKALDQGEILKFRRGIERVISGDLTGAGRKLRTAYKKCQAALEDINTRIHLTVLCTARVPLAPNVESVLTEFCAEQNEVDEVFTLHYLGFESLYRLARFFSPDASTDITAHILQCGIVEEPYRSFFGAVSGADVAEWVEKHGMAIFNKNVRFTLHDSEVNEEIFFTIEEEPEKFWYYNNGLTAISREARKAPSGGDKTVVTCQSFSIVNGAQTAGMLARAKQEGLNLRDVRVPFRVISLVGTEPGFDEDITKANNTQNELRPLDFVSLDPRQEMLQNEISSLGYQYIYKRGSERDEDREQIEVKDLALALACAAEDLAVTVQAKRYISGLWKSIKTKPYTEIFSEELNGERAVYCYEAHKRVDVALKKMRQSLDKEDGLILTHGDKFVSHCVFQKLRAAGYFEANEGLDEVETIANEMANATIHIYKKKFGGSYPATVFKNQSVQETLRSEVFA